MTSQTDETAHFDEVEAAIPTIPSRFPIALAAAKELAARAEGVAITDVEDEGQVTLARGVLHELRSAHGAIERRRKELKAPVLEIGRAIDGVAKELQSVVAPARDAVQVEVDKVKAHEEAKAQAEQERRLAVLAAFETVMHPDALAALSPEAFEEVVESERARFEKEQARRKAEEEQRLAAAEQERKERERVAAEAKLEREKREKAEAEAKAKAEADAARIAELEAEVAASKEKEAEERAAVEQASAPPAEVEEPPAPAAEPEPQPLEAPSPPAEAYTPTTEDALVALVAVAEGFLDLFPGAGAETPEGRLATKARVALKLHRETQAVKR